VSTLATYVQARVPAQRLKELTNGRAPNAASTINSTVLEAAVTSACAEFPTHAQEDFDETEPAHLVVAYRGVIAFLKEFLGQEEAPGLMVAYHQELERMATTRARGRLEPDTLSELQPSEDLQDGDGVARPDFDDRRFADLTPKPPGGARDSFWNNE